VEVGDKRYLTVGSKPPRKGESMASTVTRRFDLWTHGVQAQVQQYDALDDPGLASVRVRRNKSGATITKSQNDGRVRGVWCHLAILTPTMLESRRAECERYYLRAHVNGQATIRKIHIYQGERRVLAYDDLTLSDRDLDEEFVNFRERDAGPAAVWRSEIYGPSVICIYIELEDDGEALIRGAAGTFVGVGQRG
jgi:hypothetical protein